MLVLRAFGSDNKQSNNDDSDISICMYTNTHTHKVYLHTHTTGCLRELKATPRELASVSSCKRDLHVLIFSSPQLLTGVLAIC